MVVETFGLLGRRAGGERNLGPNDNDLAILARRGRADGRAAGRRQTCMRRSPFLVGRLFLSDSTVAVLGYY